MGIPTEFNLDLALRAFGTKGRTIEECLPKKLEPGKIHSFLKKGQRHYYLEGEIPLLETKGNQKLSSPLASITILEATHFLDPKTDEPFTNGLYLINEVYDVNDKTIHFERMNKMKIFIGSSKHFYDRIPEIKTELEALGHIITLPNSYDNPLKEEEMKSKGLEAHVSWKSEMLKRNKKNIEPNDAILVLNFVKEGQQNYIGGATFMEIVKAWELNKKLFLYNPIPQIIFTDELIGMNPIILNGDLSKIK